MGSSTAELNISDKSSVTCAVNLVTPADHSTMTLETLAVGSMLSAQNTATLDWLPCHVLIVFRYCSMIRLISSTRCFKPLILSLARRSCSSWTLDEVLGIALEAAFITSLGFMLGMFGTCMLVGSTLGGLPGWVPVALRVCRL